MNIINISKQLPRNSSRRYPYLNASRVTHIIPHHSATFGKDAYHHARSHLANGWPGIAYYLFIDSAGKVYKCHEIDEMGYHCKGMNHRSIGICIEGNFQKRRPTQAQMDACYEAILHINFQIGRQLEVGFHDSYRPTVCPGRYFPKHQLTMSVMSYYALMDSSDQDMYQADIPTKPIAEAPKNPMYYLRNAFWESYIYKQYQKLRYA
ncbi:MAG: peptidoglycan recognition family protein, partial [Bacteroidota bacterium]